MAVEGRGAHVGRASPESLGKIPDQRLLMIGTRAPGDPNGWWCNLLAAGSGDGVNVEVIAAPEDREDDPQPWDSPGRVIQQGQPVDHGEPYAYARRSLRERNRARRDPSERASFRGVSVKTAMWTCARKCLISLADWKAVEARPVPDRAGKVRSSRSISGRRAPGPLRGVCGRPVGRKLFATGSGDTFAGRRREARRNTKGHLSAAR